MEVKGINMIDKRKVVVISDLLNAIPGGIWFDAPEVKVDISHSNIRSRLKGIKEFQVRKLPKPGTKNSKVTQFYISNYDLNDLKKRIGKNGKIISTKNPKQVITKNVLSSTDILLNRFLGVTC